MAYEFPPCNFFKEFYRRNDLGKLKDIGMKDENNKIMDMDNLKITSDLLMNKIKSVALYSGSNCFFNRGKDYDYFLNRDDPSHKDLWEEAIHHLGVKETDLISFEVEAEYEFLNFKAEYGNKLINVILLNETKFITYQKATNRFLKLINQFPDIADCLYGDKDARIKIFNAFKTSQGTFAKAAML